MLHRWQSLLPSLALGVSLLGMASLGMAHPGDAAQASPAAMAAGGQNAAADWKTGPQRVGSLEVELVSDASQVVPGETFRIGLRLRHDPHWHTYWRNPGDTGFPTSFELQGPKGTQYSDIRWPAPGRLAIGPLANYGYEGEALIYRDVTLPAGFTGRQARFQLHTEWLVCKEVCIPGDASLQLDIPVGGATVVDKAEFASFEDARRHAPDATKEPATAAWWHRGSQAMVVLPAALTEGKAPKSALFLPYFAGVVRPASPQKLVEVSGEDGRYGVVLELDEQAMRTTPAGWEKEGGIVVLDDGQPVELALQSRTVVPVAARTVSVNNATQVDVSGDDQGSGQGANGMAGAGKQGGFLGQLQMGGAPSSAGQGDTKGASGAAGNAAAVNGAPAGAAAGAAAQDGAGQAGAGQAAQNAQAGAESGQAASQSGSRSGASAAAGAAGNAADAAGASGAEGSAGKAGGASSGAAAGAGASPEGGNSAAAGAAASGAGAAAGGAGAAAAGAQGAQGAQGGQAVPAGPNAAGAATNGQQASSTQGADTADTVSSTLESVTELAGGDASWLTLAGAIFGAFVGGLILNLMPCVFPVIGLKVLSFTEAAAGKPAEARRHAMVFGLGVVVSFVVLAGVLLGLRALGQAAGWGFQLQSPVFVAVLALLFVGIGLNLFGVFETGTRLTQLGSVAGQGSQQGYGSSFMTGVMAVVVATPCTAPFMGGAVGFTLSSSALLVIAVFVAIGVGMALPYLILASSQRLLSMLPRPGIWLQTFKQILAFPMFITAAWLTWVLALQADAEGVLLLLLAAIFLSFACWIYGRWQFELRPRSARSTPAWIFVAVLSLAAVVGLLSRLPVVAESAVAQAAPAQAPMAAAGMPVGTHNGFPSCRPGPDGKQPVACRGWQPWSAERFAAARAEGVPVFVDFTAAWCLSCQVNQKVALDRDEVQAAFRERNVLLLKADWTRRDPAISAELARFGRNSVPLYLYFEGRDPNAAPRQLPELLTVDTVLKAIGAAG